jgi:hypothetical protein
MSRWRWWLFRLIARTEVPTSVRFVPPDQVVNVEERVDI